MRISELAKRAGVALSAVKYYQREGLLPAGERSAPNQVSYSPAHVERVRLIRALLTTGGLSVAATKQVIASLDGGSLAETFETAQKAMSTLRANERPPSDESRERVIQLARSQGWKVGDDNPGIDAAAYALDGFSEIGFGSPEEYLNAYAAAARTAATADLQALSALSGSERMAEVMVVGTVLGDPLFAGLRRMAQQDATHDQFPIDEK